MGRVKSLVVPYWVQWCMSLIPALSGQTWDDQEFIKVFLRYLSNLRQSGIHEILVQKTKSQQGKARQDGAGL